MASGRTSPRSPRPPLLPRAGPVRRWPGRSAPRRGAGDGPVIGAHLVQVHRPTHLAEAGGESPAGGEGNNAVVRAVQQGERGTGAVGRQLLGRAVTRDRIGDHEGGGEADGVRQRNGEAGRRECQARGGGAPPTTIRRARCRGRPRRMTARNRRTATAHRDRRRVRGSSNRAPPRWRRAGEQSGEGTDGRAGIGLHATPEQDGVPRRTRSKRPRGNPARIPLFPACAWAKACPAADRTNRRSFGARKVKWITIRPIQWPLNCTDAITARARPY